MFHLDDDPTQNNIAWFLMGNFLRLSPWIGEREREKLYDRTLYFFPDNREITATP